MVHGMAMVHHITSTVHQVGHLMASQNRIHMSTTSTTSAAPLGMKKI